MSPLLNWFLGIWMLLICLKALTEGLLPKALSVTGILGGAGWVLWSAVVILSMLGVKASLPAVLSLFFGIVVGARLVTLDSLLAAPAAIT